MSTHICIYKKFFNMSKVGKSLRR